MVKSAILTAEKFTYETNFLFIAALLFIEICNAQQATTDKTNDKVNDENSLPGQTCSTLIIRR